MYKHIHTHSHVNTYGNMCRKMNIQMRQRQLGDYKCTIQRSVDIGNSSRISHASQPSQRVAWVLLQPGYCINLPFDVCRTVPSKRKPRCTVTRRPGKALYVDGRPQWPLLLNRRYVFFSAHTHEKNENPFDKIGFYLPKMTIHSLLRNRSWAPNGFYSKCNAIDGKKILIWWKKKKTWQKKKERLPICVTREVRRPSSSGRGSSVGGLQLRGGAKKRLFGE